MRTARGVLDTLPGWVPLTALYDVAKNHDTVSFVFLISCFLWRIMQPGSVVVEEDDIVHYSLFVDEYINSGKDANIDDLRAILIDSLAFMCAHFHVIDAFVLMRSFFL